MRIKVGEFIIGKEERKAINDVLDSGRLSEGPKVAEFEREWAKYIGTKYCVAVNNGTSALMAALYTIKHLYKPVNRNVLTERVTFVADYNAIKACGFKVIFNGKADISIPVHLMGIPHFIPAKYMIEDCSQAHGSVYQGKKVGTFGLMGTFSFYIAHNIQAGEMGAVVTNSEECYRTLKKIKAHGRLCDCPICNRAEGRCPRPIEPDPRFTYDMFGLNFKTMEFQAALALCQIKKADQIKEKRNANVKYLNERLGDLDIFELPLYSKDISYLAYPIKIKYPEQFGRNVIRQRLEEAGIESRPLFNDPTGFYIGCHQYLKKKDLDYAVQILHCILHT